MKKSSPLLFVIIFSLAFQQVHAQIKAVVFQTDFGLKDGAVAEMKGVAYAVAPDLKLFDLTHEIPAFNVWEAAYRLQQAAPFWPTGTVFVSVVDPGVGTQRKSVVLKTKTGQFFVTPDNGTLTLVAQNLGIDEIREIDETKNRRPGSEASNTFHGRDVYAYTAAKLASGTITFREVGAKLPNEVVKINYQKPEFNNNVVKGNIPILDVQYGNVWTNIDTTTFNNLNVKTGDSLLVTIMHNKAQVFQRKLPYVSTFAMVRPGRSLIYINSLYNAAFAINQDNFAREFKVSSGPEWHVTITHVKK